MFFVENGEKNKKVFVFKLCLLDFVLYSVDFISHHYLSVCFCSRVAVHYVLKVWRTIKPLMDNYHSEQLLETPVCSPTTSYHSSAPAKRRRKMRSESHTGKT